MFSLLLAYYHTSVFISLLAYERQFSFINESQYRGKIS